MSLIQTLEGHSFSVRSVSFSPDGTKVASGSEDETVKLWDVMSGECLQTLEGHSYRVWRVSDLSLSFSPYGMKVAFLSRNIETFTICTFVYTSIAIEATHMLIAFASGKVNIAPLDLVRRMYPQFYDQKTQRYLFYNDDTKKIELKTETEVSNWYEIQLNKSTTGSNTSSNASFLLKFAQLKF